jgi:hypothetical protein
LKRQLSLPISTMSQWWVRRSSSAVVIFGSPNTLGHSAEGEIGGDQNRGALVEPADEVEEELAAGLGERQLAELIEDGEVHAGEIIGDTALPPPP